METSQGNKLALTHPGNRAALLMTGLGVMVVLVSFFFWHDTWFGRRLNDQEITAYLEDTQHPRKIQHALSQIVDRIVKGDPAVKQWNSRTLALVENPNPEIRATVAWVLGEDASFEAFHQALLKLLGDPDLMVRRNAALGLVRFNDNRGRQEIVNILKPYNIYAPAGGHVAIQLTAGQAVGNGDLLARITKDDNQKVEIRAPLPGQIENVAVQDGSTVPISGLLLSISPKPNHVWEALRGLYFVGEAEDLQVIKPFEAGVPGMPERIRQQALATSQAIRTRAEHNSNP